MVDMHIQQIFDEYVRFHFVHDNFPISNVEVQEEGLNLILELNYETTINTREMDYYPLIQQYGTHITSYLEKYFIHTAWVEKHRNKTGGFKLSIILVDDIIPELINSLHQISTLKDLAKLRFMESNSFYSLLKEISLPFLKKYEKIESG